MLQVAAFVSRASVRNFGVTAAAYQKAGQPSDEVQKIFVEKIREYAQKSKSAKGGLVDATPDALKSLNQEIDRVNKTFGFKSVEEVEKLPPFSFPDPKIDSPVTKQ